MASFPNTSRRIFRGRGGANDRRLPKFQARRRKNPAESKQSSENDESNLSNPKIDYSAIDAEDDEEEFMVLQINSLDFVGSKLIESSGLEQEEREEDSSPPFSQSERAEVAKEVKHLLKRIQNVSQSTALSSTSISNPEIWKANVLNAVQNASHEWHSILLKYNTIIDDSQKSESSNAVYSLIQQAMQSGPLTCSNPGYFKRCGAVVASIALQFLNDTVPDPIELQFTERQARSIEKWKVAAESAVSKGKPPTKSQIKKQTGSKGKGGS
jgi:hypothetical protein